MLLGDELWITAGKNKPWAVCTRGDQSRYYKEKTLTCSVWGCVFLFLSVCTRVRLVCVCHGFRPISWKSVAMLNRGCNQPVISHVHRKVCLADWGCLSFIQFVTAPGRALKIFWQMGTDNKRSALLFNNEDSSVNRWKFRQHIFMCDLPFCPPWRRCNEASALSFAPKAHSFFSTWYSTCDLSIFCSGI